MNKYLFLSTIIFLASITLASGYDGGVFQSMEENGEFIRVVDYGDYQATYVYMGSMFPKDLNLTYITTPVVVYSYGVEDKGGLRNGNI